MVDAQRSQFLAAASAMAAVVLASNILVQYPVGFGGLQDYLTYGAFTYPFAFLVTDLANRRFGAQGARRVVYVGFVAAVILSAALATPRIAIASGTAFLVAQLVDVGIFDRLRGRAWWLPPLVSSVIASALDTAIFFSLAFYCGPFLGGAAISDLLAFAGVTDVCVALPWMSLAAADFGVKVALALIALVPYGAISASMPARA